MRPGRRGEALPRIEVYWSCAPNSSRLAPVLPRMLQRSITIPLRKQRVLAIAGLPLIFVISRTPADASVL